MAALAALADSFSSPLSNRWTFGNFAGTENSATAITNTGGTLNIAGNTNAAQYAQIISNTSYDVTGGIVAAQLVSYPSTTLDVFFTLTSTATASTVSAMAGFRISGGILNFDFGNASVGSSLTYSATAHRWLRIREAAGTTYWEYTSDITGLGGWVTQATLGNQWTMSTSWVRFIGSASDTAVAKFDNLNYFALKPRKNFGQSVQRLNQF
jgi:hypothetical protein